MRAPEGAASATATRSNVRLVLGSSRLPVALLALAVGAVLVANDVSPASVLLFVAEVCLGIALPGMLWLRLLRRTSAHIAEDLALGLALGYGILIAAYVVARAAGVPELHLAWAFGTLVAFAAVPRLRPYWRGSGERAPLGWTWGLCLVLVVVLVHSAGVFSTHRLTGVDTPYLDMPYQLALIGELRHHVPPTVPYVAGEPLAYHWFFYAQAAAISWATGVEPVVLLYRLAVLPLLCGFVVLTAVAARRVTGVWWAGPLAAALALVGSVPAPWRWLGQPLSGGVPVFDTQSITTLWVSPTHAFGLLLFGAALLVLMDRLTGGASLRTTRMWVLFTILVFAASGAKASALPVLLAGLGVVLVVGIVHQRRLDGEAVRGASLMLAVLVLAIVFVYGGSSGGLQIGLESLRSFPLAASVGAVGARGVPSLAIPALVLAIALVLWIMQAAAAVALVAGRAHARGDSRLWLLLGAAGGAIGAATLLSYPGLSQWYYLRGVAGVYGILAAWGLARLAGPRPAPRVVGAAAAAAVAGAVIGLAVHALGPAEPPRLRRDGLAAVTLDLLLPLALLVAGLLGGLLVLRVLLARRPGIPAGLLAATLVMGVALPAAVGLAARPILTGSPSGAPTPREGVEAARWLRDHSTPDDLVATNLHCLHLVEGRCDARHFWVSAFSERRMLVEGWAYTAKAVETPRTRGMTDRTAPFWDPERLAVNDAAFIRPSSGVRELRARYAVRWLFADLASADATGLARAAIERFRGDRYAVYEVPAAP